MEEGVGPKLSNLNKMKRQRNSQQIKEQDKCPPNQTKEEPQTARIQKGHPEHSNINKMKRQKKYPAGKGTG